MTKWINFYRTPSGCFYTGGAFDSKDEARKFTDANRNYVQTLPLEIDDELLAEQEGQ